jgi:hypothetical protein
VIAITGGLGLLAAGVASIANHGSRAINPAPLGASVFFFAFGISLLAVGIAQVREQRPASHDWTLRQASWLVFAVFAGALFIGRPWSLALGGLVLLMFALALGTNWRGALDAMPRGAACPFAGPQGATALRATFLLFGAIGAVVFVTGLVKLVA